MPCGGEKWRPRRRVRKERAAWLRYIHGSPSIALRVCVGRPSVVAAVKTRFDGNGGGRERARERTAERRVAKQVRSRGELSPASITKNRLEWNGSCSQRTRKTEASDFSASV